MCGARRAGAERAAVQRCPRGAPGRANGCGRRRLMDLHVRHAAPTDDERAAVDALLGPPPSSWFGGARGGQRDAHVAIGGRETRRQRHLLLPALQALQSRVGWISETGLDYVCTRLDVAPAVARAVPALYALPSTPPRSSRGPHLCDHLAV